VWSVARIRPWTYHFLLHAADVLRLTQLVSRRLHPHAYADDSQIYGFCRRLETVSPQGRLSACIDHASL